MSLQGYFPPRSAARTLNWVWPSRFSVRLIRPQRGSVDAGVIMKSWFVRLTVLACLAAFVVGALPGCGGCTGEDPIARKRREIEEERKKKQKEKEKPKPDFEMGQLRIQPSDGGADKSLVKPGHWVAATTLMKANNFDFPADLESATVNSSQRPYDVEHTRFHLLMSRPAALPKGQTMQFETIYFVPHGVPREQRLVLLETKLRGSRGGREQAAASQGVIQMPLFQYLILVLSATPDSYQVLDVLDSIRPVTDDIDDADNNIQFYRVVRPKLEGRMPLPTNALTWTSIAYLFWDDVDPNQLSSEQQHALLDWLHFGGQLIVNGPSSLDKLKGSFLSDYLPADKVKSISLEQAAFEELNARWSLPEVKKNGQRRMLTVVPEKPPLGVELKLHPQGSFVNDTGALLAERRVGRGRIAVSAFPITNREVVNWPGFDGFFNACLLRRPPRQYVRTEFTKPKALWHEYEGLMKDARLVTTLRYFSRDIGHAAGKAAAEGRDTMAPENEAAEIPISLPGDDVVGTPRNAVVAAQTGAPGSPPFAGRPGSIPVPGAMKDAIAASNLDPDTDDPHFGGFRSWAQSGVAGWNDFSGAAMAARLALTDASGIKIPKSGFVLRVLLVYLVVLVPLNWGFFRLLGRVEWAWIAAPIIALVGAGAVIRMAQLDIGFARSRSEIAILEAHGGYSRGHLTRYTALYTSLTSGYDLTFDDPSSLAQPFALVTRDGAYERPRTEPSIPVYFRRDKQVSLKGFQVNSNSSDKVHCEQMFDLGGGLHLTGDETKGFVVENKTDLALQDVGVLRRDSQGRVLGAWVGALAAKTSAPLGFQPLADQKKPWLPEWDASPATSRSRAGKNAGVSLWRIIDLACDRLRLNKGEVRLVGWTDREVPGVSIRPGAAQTTLRTLVLAHLQHGPLPAARPDVNMKDDVQETREPLREDEVNPPARATLLPGTNSTP